MDSRQLHLDLICFPVLFPNGKFGEHYAREVKITSSDYIKSRLLNKDSRFRKDPQYVFYLLWLTELRQLTAGIFNMLRSGKHQHGLTVQQFLNGVSSSCENVEANLSTVLNSVRGTKQYWFMRNSELKCMIREWGTPTLFLTFSCAEYESPEIINYLKKVNNMPVGGTGKSFLIETIRAQVKDNIIMEREQQNLTCAIVAPTGLAAFNIGGVTIHRLFQLPIEHESNTTYWCLGKMGRKILYATLKCMKRFDNRRSVDGV